MKMKLLFMTVILLTAQVFAATVALDGPWYTGSPDGTPSISDPNSDTFIWGTDGSITESAQKGGLWSYFPAQSLVDDGDLITLSFDLTPADSNALSRDVRFGLFDSGSSQVIGNLNGANSDDGFLNTLGYFATWEQGSTGENATLYARTAPKTSPVSNTSNVSLMTVSPVSPTLQQSTTYSITFSVVRYTETLYGVTSSIDNGQVSGTTEIINATSFDTVVLQNLPTGVDVFQFANLTVTTGKAQYPLIISQPQNTSVIDGQSASFVVTATNPLTGDTTGMTYQWYYGLPGDTSTPVGTGSPTHTIPVVSAADEGSYYFIVTLTATGETSESQPANLTVKRLIQHYTFDNNLLDSVGTNDGTPVAGGPDFVDGVLGKAAQFYADRYIDIGTGAYPNYLAGLDQGTISFWLNSTSTTGGSIISTLNSTDDTMLNVNFSGTGMRLAIRDAVGNIRQTDITNINLINGQWYHLAFTYTMGSQAEVTAYVNGQAHTVNISAAGNPQAFTAWEFPMYIGAQNARGTTSSHYYGELDDLRVYNYPLSAIEVATMYTNATGQSVCVDPPAYDFDGDCKVTVSDLAQFVSGWLECGKVPSCQ